MNLRVVDRPEEIDALELVAVHCRMLQYGMSLSFSTTLEHLGVVSKVPRLYNIFALMHLVVTMFLVDGENGSRGGACYRLLHPLGLEKWLKPIDRIMQRKVGATTLGRYLRVSRNKLATHGDLSFASLPAEMQAIPSSTRALGQFERAMQRLQQEVRKLEERASQRLDRLRPPISSARDDAPTV